MVARFPGANAVSQALVGRTVLPLRVIEQLFTAVSNSLRQALMARRDIPADTLDEIVLHGRERATIGYIAMGGEADQVESLVRHLHARQRLTPSIVARSIMMGDFIFAAAMAVRAGITVTAAQILLGDPGPLGLKALYSRAKMPDHFYPAVRAAVDVLVEIEIRRRALRPRAFLPAYCRTRPYPGRRPGRGHARVPADPSGAPADPDPLGRGVAKPRFVRALRPRPAAAPSCAWAVFPLPSLGTPMGKGFP